MPLKTLFFSLLVTLSFLAQAEQRKILVIESYHAEYPWDASYMEGLRAVLGEKYAIDTFQMDTKRIPKSEFQGKADAAFARFEASKPDLVILGDDNAFKFLAEKINASGTPTVFLGINSNPRNLNLAKMNQVTGILERPLYKRGISEIGRMMNNKVSKILVLFDSGTTSQAAVEETFKNNTSIEISGIQVDLKLIGDLDEWKQTVNSAKDNDYNAIVVGLYHTIVDTQGASQPAAEVLQWTSENAPVPIFGFWDFSVGANATAGGLVLFGQTQGEAAAEMADQILSGAAKPADISPKVGDKGRYFFSKAQLAKWQIQLPADIQKKATLIE